MGVENGRRRVRRHPPFLAAVALLATILLAAQPRTPAAASSPSCVVPYLAVGSSTLVAGVTTVTATVTTRATSNFSTAPLFSPWVYYFSTIDPDWDRLVLTFSPAVAQVALDPEYNNDAPNRPPSGTNFERFTFQALDDTGVGVQVVATAIAENSDETVVLGDGTTANISRLEIDYTADSTTDRASLLNVLLPGTCPPTLTPSTQIISGTIGQPLAATDALVPAGFGGDVTYAVTAGTLPAGLTLNTTTGVVSGTPTTAGTSSVTITGTGATAGTATAAMSFDVSAPASLPAPRAPSLALDCTPDSVAGGAVVTCGVSNGQPGIDMLWNAIAAGTVFDGRGITLDGSGSGSFTFLAPRGVDAVDVELVAWGVSDTVRVVGGLVPTAVPAGQGARDGMPSVVALMAVAAALVLRGFRHLGRGGLRWGHGR